LQSEKELEFLAAPFGIAGIECALGLYIKALIEPKILDWPGLIRLMTVKPAGIIGIDKGTLSKGKQGDVTIIDPEAAWSVDVHKFVSKSRNCPYHDWKIKGKVEATIVGGEVRFEAGAA
jgi:dihydroorotase